MLDYCWFLIVTHGHWNSGPPCLAILQPAGLFVNDEYTFAWIECHFVNVTCFLCGVSIDCCSSLSSDEDLDKTNLITRRLVTMSSEMANKPNVGMEWSGTGRTDQSCVWSWWSAIHSVLAQLSFLLGLQSLPLFCCLTALVDEFAQGCAVFCKLFPCLGINAKGLQGGLQCILKALPLASNRSLYFG